MESVKKRSRWALAVAVAALALITVSLTTGDASAVTGSPQLTLNLTFTGNANNRVIHGGGVYSDPDGVCQISGKSVVWTITYGTTAGGLPADNGTATTEASGTYTFTSKILPNNTNFFVSVTVSGTVNGSYGLTDVCPNVTTTGTIKT